MKEFSGPPSSMFDELEAARQRRSGRELMHGIQALDQRLQLLSPQAPRRPLRPVMAEPMAGVDARPLDTLFRPRTEGEPETIIYTDGQLPEELYVLQGATLDVAADQPIPDTSQLWRQSVVPMQAHAVVPLERLIEELAKEYHSGAWYRSDSLPGSVIPTFLTDLDHLVVRYELPTDEPDQYLIEGSAPVIFNSMQAGEQFQYKKKISTAVRGNVLRAARLLKGTLTATTPMSTRSRESMLQRLASESHRKGYEFVGYKVRQRSPEPDPADDARKIAAIRNFLVSVK